MTDDFFVTRPRTYWDGEPTPAEKRKSHYHFSVSIGQTLQDLRDELDRYRCAEAEIELAMDPHLIGYDGLPFKGAKATDPGVAIRFEWRQGWMRLQCDTFDDWRANVRAIVLYLERMRLANAYGIKVEGQLRRDEERIEQRGAVRIEEKPAE